MCEDNRVHIYDIESKKNYSSKLYTSIIVWLGCNFDLITLNNILKEMFL